MTKLVDPDSLNQATEVVIDTGAKTIQLLVAGNLDDNSPGKTSGVTLQAVHSFLKEEWRTDAALNRFKFPLKPIFEAKFNWQNGWAPADAQTRDLIRDAGWQEIDGSRYSCMISLGAFNATSDQAYYQNVTGFDQSTLNFDKTGELNEAVQILDESGSPTFNFLTFFKAFNRIEAKSYDEYNLLTEQDISSLDYRAYSFPLSNENLDIKVTNSDATVSSTSPWNNVTIDYHVGNLFASFAPSTAYSLDDVVQDADDTGRWFICTVAGTSGAGGSPLSVSNDSGTATFVSYAGERQIGSSWFAFNRIVDANDSTAAITKEEIYERLQWELRQVTDINDDIAGDAFGTVNGNIAERLAFFEGDTLKTFGGVYIDDFNANDTNALSFGDITVDGGGLDAFGVPVTTTDRTFPFVAAGTLSFSANYVADATAEYRMYFTNDDAGDNAGNDYDTSGAIVVNDNGGSPIEGSITTATIAFDFDYDGNVQRGAGSAGVDAPVTVVAISNSVEWVIGEFTITRATGLSFPVNGGDDLVYNNP